MRRLLVPLSLGAALGLAASSCSFTTATGFTECTADVDCGFRGACARGYCVPMPLRCYRDEGSFNTVDRIPLAALLPLTTELDGGVPDSSELAGLNAFRLAVSEVNANGGLKGRLFALFTCDTGRDSQEIASQVAFFTSQLGVPAIFTSGSSQTIAAYHATSDAGTLIMSATATSRDLIPLYKETHSVWRTAPPDSLQALVLSEIARVDYKAKRPTVATSVGIIYEEGSYGHGLADALSEDLGQKNVSVRTFFYDANALDPTKIFNELTKITPAINVTVLVAFPPELTRLVKAAQAYPSLRRDAGHDWAMADSAKDPSIIDRFTQPELTGMLGTAPAMGAGLAFRDFSDRYKGRFNVNPADYGYTAQSYDAMYSVLIATAWGLGKGLISGPNLSEGLTRVSAKGQQAVRIGATGWITASNALFSQQSIDLQGASGELDFDFNDTTGTGATPAPYEVWTVRDGGFATVKIVTK